MKLSRFLKSPTPLTDEDVHTILMELAIRQETVERVMADRLNVLLTGLEGICSCSWSLELRKDAHYSVCPTARLQGGADEEQRGTKPHHEEVSDSVDPPQTTVSGSLTKAQLMHQLYKIKTRMDQDAQDVPDGKAEAMMFEADAIAIAIKLAEVHYEDQEKE